ncbi:flagellar FlbD family protein [Alkalibacterium sp. 20]|uniref:flagellar FlbD family protein n=1 Tax=Alkalibacterium sp. 20 TaxID=1798803 RepID=UPI0009001B63|nr:flagellar FlbD family protein [Alkalibacterium sp. 20]OJF90881.1 endoflagellar protein [Alkalibacterium sp. 20]
MIALRTVSGKEFYLNNELILKMEREYDTLITLVDYKTIRVMETPAEIAEKVIDYKREIYQSSTGV